MCAVAENLPPPSPMLWHHPHHVSLCSGFRACAVEFQVREEKKIRQARQSISDTTSNAGVYAARGTADQTPERCTSTRRTNDGQLSVPPDGTGIERTSPASSHVSGMPPFSRIFAAMHSVDNDSEDVRSGISHNPLHVMGCDTYQFEGDSDAGSRWQHSRGESFLQDSRWTGVQMSEGSSDDHDDASSAAPWDESKEPWTPRREHLVTRESYRSSAWNVGLASTHDGSIRSECATSSSTSCVQAPSRRYRAQDSLDLDHRRDGQESSSTSNVSPGIMTEVGSFWNTPRTERAGGNGNEGEVPNPWNDDNEDGAPSPRSRTGHF